MGVITVEKCLFYLQIVDVKTKVRRPGFQIGADTYTLPGERKEYQVKTARLPYLGEAEKTIGYLHTDQIGSLDPRFQSKGAYLRVVEDNLVALRNFFLGKEPWTHPKLIVADIPREQLLMSRKDMGDYFVRIAQQSLRLPRELKPRLLTPRSSELWLPWDPTLPGKVPANSSTSYRYASQAIGLPLAKGIEDDLGYENRGKAILLGTGFKLRYYQAPPPDVHWVPQIQNRVMGYLRAIGVENPDEWYALGQFEPAGDFPDTVDRFRGQKFQNYVPHTGIVPIDINSSSTVMRRIYKVQARSPEEAKNKIRAHLHRLAQAPETRKVAVERALAWTRTGEKVVARPAWDVMMKRKARLNEELYPAL